MTAAEDASIGLARGLGAGVGILEDNSLFAASTVDLALHTLGSIPAGLLGGLSDSLSGSTKTAVLLATRLLLGVAALDVASDKEAHEEVGERSEVEDIEPGGKVLAAGGDAGNVDALDAINHTGGGLRADGRRGG